MSKFLLVFDRRRGLVQPPQRFEDAREAVRARLDAERVHATEPDLEVVVLGAESEDHLRRTHARYFESFQEIAARALTSWAPNLS